MIKPDKWYVKLWYYRSRIEIKEKRIKNWIFIVKAELATFGIKNLEIKVKDNKME
jgi:hypothetical protein